MTSVPSGNAGFIEIRDTGSVVEFWVGCSDPATNFGSAGWSGSINGVAVGGSFGFPAGAGSVRVASYSVSSSQTVSFAIGATGTSGLGGPTSMSASVSRATVPPAPRVTGSDAGLDMVTRTGMRFRFWATGDGGSPITKSQYQVSTSPTFAGAPALDTSGTVIRNDLTPNTIYWWRAWCVNAVGLGYASTPISARTLPAGFLGGKGGAFVPFPTTVGKGSAFVDTQIFIGKGGTFVPLG